jgi:hypothetical protein
MYCLLLTLHCRCCPLCADVLGANGVSAFIVADAVAGGRAVVGGGRGGAEDGGSGSGEVGSSGDSKLKMMLLSRLRDASRS